VIDSIRSGAGGTVTRFERARARLLIAVVLLLAASNAAAMQWFVQSGGASVGFAPQFLTIQPGDSVTFVNIGGNHNVVADDGSFRCAHGCDGDGQGGSGNATSDLWFATVTFPTPGTIGYFCEPHGAPGSGMYGTIIVAPREPAPIREVPADSLWFELLLAAALLAATPWRWPGRSGMRRHTR